MDLARVAPAFVEMAHRIVWASVATVDPNGRPRTRILHPIWEWNGTLLVGWIATDPTSPKAAHLAANPAVSVNYWAPDHDTCTADCRASWITDNDGRTEVWRRFAEGPESAVTTRPSFRCGPTGRRQFASPACGSSRGCCGCNRRRCG